MTVWMTLMGTLAQLENCRRRGQSSDSWEHEEKDDAYGGGYEEAPGKVVGYPDEVPQESGHHEPYDLRVKA